MLVIYAKALNISIVMRLLWNPFVLQFIFNISIVYIHYKGQLLKNTKKEIKFSGPRIVPK
jgi:hypothetical protein